MQGRNGHRDNWVRTAFHCIGQYHDEALPQTCVLRAFFSKFDTPGASLILLQTQIISDPIDSQKIMHGRARCLGSGVPHLEASGRSA